MINKLMALIGKVDSMQEKWISREMGILRKNHKEMLQIKNNVIMRSLLDSTWLRKESLNLRV